MTNFYSIQISGIQMSEDQTEFSPVFKWHFKNGPLGDQTTFDHLNTRLVQESDPRCMLLTLGKNSRLFW